MLTQTQSKAKGLADLPPVNSDSLLALIALANADPRPDKIDVGVGVFRDAVGNTPILKVIKEAEQRLVDTQVTKAYLGSGRIGEQTRKHISDGRLLIGQLNPPAPRVVDPGLQRGHVGFGAGG